MEKKIDDVLRELVCMKSTLASKEDTKVLDKWLGNVEKDQANTQKRLDRLDRGMAERGGRKGREGVNEPTDQQLVDYMDARRSILISRQRPTQPTSRISLLPR